MGSAASRRRDRDRHDLAAVESTPSEHRPAPPTKHPRQLAVALVLMLAWILFLAWMAFAG